MSLGSRSVGQSEDGTLQTGQTDSDQTPSVLNTSEQSSFTAVPATLPSPLTTTEVRFQECCGSQSLLLITWFLLCLSIESLAQSNKIEQNCPKILIISEKGFFWLVENPFNLCVCLTCPSDICQGLDICSIYIISRKRVPFIYIAVCQCFHQALID